ncbi:M20 metallopeptidase family protein [Saccharopolyspora hattusasensis]|uniref:M20 metallopeptidase family protein n=1 Tax=Saccharopolyspora hattusasensis TaxID=1128679 RepID=UPI003D952696
MSERELQDELVRLRRQLHAEPEIGLDLPRTQEKVLAALDGLPLEITTGTGLSSITAVLRGSRPGPTVLLRGDMDALPVTERTGLDYTSRFDGRMHACGHDLHTAMLVGAARLLTERHAELAGDVVLMFQPGEEGCDGAGKMIAEGVLEASGSRPVAAYGMHVMAARHGLGTFLTRRGPLMAGGDLLRVTVRGAGGHGSTPHRAKDPIAPACEMVGALQALVARTIDPFETLVLTIGSFHSGNAGNVIPGEAVFDGSLRWFSASARDAVWDGITSVCNGVAAAHGVKVDVELSEYVRATINDDAEAEFAAQVATELRGDRFSWLDRPVTGGEDFSRVLEQVPGAFIFLGACPPDRDPDTAPDNHSQFAVFDDSVLADGAALYAELAIHRLARA